MKPATHILGIDIAKDKFDVNLRSIEGGSCSEAQFLNNIKGFKALFKWLINHGTCQAALVHACMESTSRYGDGLAEFLHIAGCQVTMINPRRTRHYADSQLTRTVNDRIDARIIADFCAAERGKLRLWEPLSPEHRQLRDITRARQALIEQRERFANMLETAGGLARKAFIKSVAQLQRQIEQLEHTLEAFVSSVPLFQEQVALAASIPGVGLVTAATVIAELPPIEKIPQARQAVALFGLDPISKTSGTSVKTLARISRMGSRRGRRALYMPAMVALKRNPIITALGRRLQSGGHGGKYVIVAAMRKLLRLIYGVLKQAKPFDADWTTTRRQTQSRPAMQTSNP